MDSHYDVIVIGGGTAGANAARAALSVGAHTAMIHDPQWWNLCIQRGCMPSKSMLATAEAAHSAQTAGTFQGVSTSGNVTVDFSELLTRKDTHVARFETALQDSLKKEAFHIIHGKAFFTDAGDLTLTDADGGTQQLSAKRYVIATGSTPFVPPIDGLADVPYITSDDVMENRVREVPNRLIVLGGGPIGLEMSTVFARAGSEVHIVEMGELLGRYAPEFGKELTCALSKRDGITVHAPAKAVQIAKRGSDTVCTVEKNGEESTITGDAVLVATGRMPNIKELGLEHVGVLTEDGKLSFDERTQTANRNIYAAGDVTKDIQILHVAAEEGRIAGYNAGVGSAEKVVDYDRLSMGVIFTDPPVAHIGPSNDELVNRPDIVTSTISFPETGRAITMGVEHGLWQMCAERETGKIISSTILGPRADDLIFQVFLVKELGANVHDLANLYAYHPTLSEQFINLVSDLSDKISRT